MLKILPAIIWIFNKSFKSFQLSESIITKGLIRLNILHVFRLITWLLFKSIQKTSNWIVFSSELLDKLRKFSRIAWRIEISILFETLFGQISNSTKERSIDRWILDLRSETRTFLFSFRSREKSKRDDDGNMRRAIFVSAIIVRRVSFICHLFGDQFSVYIIIAKKRKTTRVSSNYNDAMIIFSILNRKKNRADSPCNQRGYFKFECLSIFK